jgi:DNA-binding protein YbaB
VEIAPEVLEDADSEMLQDLVLAAFNQAQEAIEQMTAEKLGPFSNMLGM